ncbi:hypothetical protein ACGWYS_000108 [Enterococcus faecalis]
MVRYESFHGTVSDIAKNKIKYDKNNIEITNYETEYRVGIANQRRQRKKPKSPGSLGYGFYTFVYTKDLAENFISKSHSDYSIIKVTSEFEEDEILNFDEKDIREKFHVYRQIFLEYAERICKQFGNISNNHKQHTFDGLVIENFIKMLEKKEKKKVSSVLMWTFTPRDELDEDKRFVSYIPNGLELCVRNLQNIILLEEEKL